MKRRAFNFLSAASLLMCVATCMLWERTYRRGLWINDVILYDEAGEPLAVEWKPKASPQGFTRWELESYPGGFRWERHAARTTPPGMFTVNPEDGTGLHLPSFIWWDGDAAAALTAANDAAQRIRDAGGWTGVGFGYSNCPDPEMKDPAVVATFQQAVAPCWAFAVTFAVIPVARTSLWLWRAGRTRRRRIQSLCLACGYDLRASPDRCPECGAVPAGKGGAA